MAKPNEQLKDIYRDLQEKFDNHPHIKVTPLDEDPPEKYEVKYFISGLSQDNNGNVIETGEHSVFISIPFGYPHFPPSCTPQTQTFHPDFDQAAICIGEFWNKDRSIAELIVFIGKMICGEIYSTENAFNDSAVAWYQKIADQLPFAKIDFSFSPSTKEDSLAVESEELALEGLDTLDESDIEAHPDYFNDNREDLDDDISFPTTAQQSGKASVNRVYLLIRQKRFYELSGFLNELPEDDQFDDREEIEQKISDLLEKAKKLQREADEFEHQGNPQMALELFEKVTEIVPDFPNIEENIARTQNSVALASGDWAGNDDSPEGAEDHDKEKTSPKKRITFFEEPSKTTIKILPILGGAIAIVLAIFFIVPLFSANSKLEKADQLHGQCRNFLENNQFSKAEGLCREALDELKKISVYKKSERDALQRQIAQTLSSKKMEQGLAGRIFFEGKYIKKIDMERMLELKAQKEKGDDFFAQSQWKKAVDEYNAALKTAQPISDSFIGALLQDINNKKTVAQVNLSIDRGFSLLARGELEKSKEMFSTGRDKAESLPEELGGELLSRITPKLKEIQYLQHLDLGKKYFNANDWESAIKQYEKALQLRDTSAVAVQDEDTDSLYANMAEAELFALINSAKDAFSQAKLDRAINNYQQAIDLLDGRKNLLQRINPEEIRQQLERIILRARIVQYKQEADHQLESRKFEQAIAAFDKVVKVIIKNGFENDQEFRAIIEGTKKTIAEVRGQAVIAKRVAYLEKNYKKIFEENYSAAIPEYLSEPQATFLRYLSNGRELYEIQCLESNRGRKLRLVMLYSYDPARKKWEFYSENS